MDFVVKVGVRDPQHVLENILVQKNLIFFFEIFQNFQKFQVREKSLVVLNGIYINSTLPAALPGPAGLDLVAPQALYEELLDYRSRIFGCPGYIYMYIRR